MEVRFLAKRKLSQWEKRGAAWLAVRSPMHMPPLSPPPSPPHPLTGCAAGPGQLPVRGAGQQGGQGGGAEGAQGERPAVDQVAGPDAAEVLRDVGEGRAAGGRRLPRDGHFGAGGGQRRGGLHPRHDQSRATLRPEAPLRGLLLLLRQGGRTETDWAACACTAVGFRGRRRAAAINARLVKQGWRSVLLLKNEGASPKCGVFEIQRNPNPKTHRTQQPRAQNTKSQKARQQPATSKGTKGWG